MSKKFRKVRIKETALQRRQGGVGALGFGGEFGWGIVVSTDDFTSLNYVSYYVKLLPNTYKYSS